MKKWLIIALIATTIFIVTIIGTIIYINRNNTSNIEPTSQKELANKLKENLEASNIQVVSTSNMEEKLSPNAVLTFETYYKKCNHEKKESIKIPLELINMTKDELEKQYNEWNIIEFTPQSVMLRKEEDGICDEHYLIKENEGYIAIYTIDEFGNETLKETTSVVIAYLPETDRIELKKGIKVYGKESLNARLEDYE